MYDLGDFCTEYILMFFSPLVFGSSHYSLLAYLVYSNSCDWDLIFTSVHGFKKTFSSQFLVGLEPIIKTSAVMRLLVPEDVPSRCSASVCFVPLSVALLFSLCSINGCLFQRSRWPYAQHPLEKNILLWLHKQVIRFLGGRMNGIILGTHCACSLPILVI